MRAGSQVARRDKMGAVVGITSLAERPEWFEGDWPGDFITRGHHCVAGPQEADGGTRTQPHVTRRPLTATSAATWCSPGRVAAGMSDLPRDGQQDLLGLR